MSPKDFHKKFLSDLDIPARDLDSVKKVLDVLQSEPTVMRRAVPPAGYEDELIKNLRMKLPPERSLSAAPQRRKEDQVPKRSWFFSPAFSWSITGALTVMFVALTVTFRNHTTFETSLSPADLLAQAVRQTPSREIASWVASVGDSATQLRVVRSNMNAIAEEFCDNPDHHHVDQAINKVAADAGITL